MNDAGLEIIESRVIRGPTITAADVAAVQRLLVEQPQAGRCGLALALCAYWQWRAANGRWKVRWALAILTELERQGWIGLPPSQPVLVRSYRPVMARPEGSRVDGPLSGYRPLRWELVLTMAQGCQWLFGSAAISGGEPEVSGLWGWGPIVGGVRLAVQCC